MSIDKKTTACAGLGAVVIGRNEGERLLECVESLRGGISWLIYVDSGSSDGSVERVRPLTSDVVHLDMSSPFTAARARNAGFERLTAAAPGCRYVLFVDGDCRVADGWVARSCAVLDGNSDVAVVCGRRRERAPERSIYNRLCDIEWNTPVGETSACGGDALMRVSDFQAVHGFNPGLIAGEEPELCARLRASGKRILRIDAEMTLHDAAMTKFSQWWVRTKRSGHAYAEGAALHGKDFLRHYVRQLRSILFWGFLLPAAAVACALGALLDARSWICFAAIVLLYLLQLARMTARMSMAGVRAYPVRHAALYAFFTLLGKLPQFLGAASFHWHRLRGRRRGLFEYK